MSGPSRPSEQGLSPSAARRLDQVCNRFEAAWATADSANQRPRIEDFLEDTPESERSALLRELIVLDMEYRRRAGESPLAEDYRDRFPSFDGAQLATVLPVIPETALPAGPVPDTLDLTGPAEMPRVAIPGYLILGELGRGGMGIVYKARQLALNRLVALKMIKSGAGADVEQLERFQTEARVIALLQHPNIVHVYEVGEHEGQPYLALEFVEGMSLHQRLRGAPLPAQEAAQLVATLAQAMQVVHQRDVIHRDLKPANVLLNAEGTPKITDFGLAKRLEVGLGQTLSGAVVGTPSYMPPEQARGDTRKIGPLADVYALGAILYETLTGRPPFKAASVYETLGLVCSAEPLAPSRLQPAVPRDLETICLKCLQKEPAKRYASALALAEDLDRFLSDTPIHARRTPPWERAIKWVRRRPAVAAVLVLTITASLALVVAVLASAQARVAEARSNQQEALQRQQLLTLQGQAQEFVLAGQSAMTAQNWQAAAKEFEKALAMVRSEPPLADLRQRADDLLTEVKSKLADEEERRRERENYQKFVKLRNDALFHATLYNGRDPVFNLKATKEAARQALDIFRVKLDSREGPTLGRFADAQQQKEIRESCYELLLLLAEAVSFNVPGQVPEERRLALAILDRASSLGVTSQAWHLYRARCLAALGEMKAAEQERQRAEATPPTSALDCFLSGNEKLKSGELEQATKDLENAVRLQAKHFWAQYFLGICYLKRHRPTEARASLTSCLALREEFIGTYLLRGFAHAELQDYQAAEEDFAQALQLKPDNEDRYAIFVNRGVMRIRQDRLRDGMEDLQRAVSLNRNQYNAYVNLARGYQRSGGLALPSVGASTAGLLESPLGQGPFLAAPALISGRTIQLKKAVEQIDQAIKLAPGLEPLYRIRAQLHLELHDLDAAFLDLEKAIGAGRNQKNPVSLAEIYFEQGRIQHIRKRYAEAARAYEEGLRFRPDYADVYRLRGHALLELHCYPEAIDSFDHYLASARPDRPTYLARAWAKAMLNKHSSAIEDYTLALRIQPDSDTLSSRGSLYLLCDAPKLAQTDFEEAIRLNPKNAHAFNGLGYARVVQGDYRDGIQQANTALWLGPENTRLLYNAARTFAQAIGKIEGDLSRRSRRDFETRYALQARAFDLIRQALKLLPAAERSSFWRNVVLTDRALDPIHHSTEWAALETSFARAAR